MKIQNSTVLSEQYSVHDDSPTTDRSNDDDFNQQDPVETAVLIIIPLLRSTTTRRMNHQHRNLSWTQRSIRVVGIVPSFFNYYCTQPHITTHSASRGRPSSAESESSNFVLDPAIHNHSSALPKKAPRQFLRSSTEYYHSRKSRRESLNNILTRHDPLLGQKASS